jgi:hypothetical protein
LKDLDAVMRLILAELAARGNAPSTTRLRRAVPLPR